MTNIWNNYKSKIQVLIASVLLVFLYLSYPGSWTSKGPETNVVFEMIRMVSLNFAIQLAFHLICWFENRLPVSLVVYMITVSYHSYFFANYGCPLIKDSRLLSDVHVHVIWTLLVLCLFTWVFLCFKSPGQVTKQNVQLEVERYPLTIMFPGGRVCRFCNTEEPARARHCE